MSKIRLRWLCGVIVLEVLAIGGLLAWAIATHPVSKIAQSSTAQLKPPKLAAVVVASGFKNPVDIVGAQQPGDKRLFVVERGGTVRIVDTGKVQNGAFLDISSRVLDDGAEMGLLGLAFDPHYAANGYFYINYIHKDYSTVIARYHVGSDGVADPASEKVLMKFKQPYSNHNGGDLHFGPDGLLYIGVGDGGGQGDPQGRAQNPAVVFGKILRIDPAHADPYIVPASNPFVGRSGGLPETWLSGFRNPWRFSFDRQTGDLYIADVGQATTEELDVLPAGDKGGENFGWRCYEGTDPYNAADCQAKSAYTMPVLEYPHDHNRCAITGGYVYRGAQRALQGKYFYADFCGHQIYYTQKTNGRWPATLALQTSSAISTFGQDSNGELYIADLNAGTISQLKDTAN